MGLILYPALIKAEASSSTAAMENDNRGYMSALNVINDFTGACLLEGEGWDAMRKHLNKHRTVIRALIMANKKMIAANKTLSSTVGGEILIEDLLRMKIRILQNINRLLRLRIAALRAAMAATPHAAGAYLAMIHACQQEILANERQIAILEEKIARLYRIEASTAVLFDAAGALYGRIANQIEAIRQEYNPSINSYSMSITYDEFEESVNSQWKDGFKEVENTFDASKVVKIEFNSEEWARQLIICTKILHEKLMLEIGRLTYEIDHGPISTTGPVKPSLPEVVEKFEKDFEKYVKEIQESEFYKECKKIIFDIDLGNIFDIPNEIVKVFAKLIALVARELADALKELAVNLINQTPDWLVMVMLKDFTGIFASFALINAVKTGDFSHIIEDTARYEKAFYRGVVKSVIDLVEGIFELPKLAFDLSDFGRDAIKEIITYCMNTKVEDMPEDIKEKIRKLIDDAGKYGKITFEALQEKISNMSDEDWMEVLGYVTVIIASFVIGGELSEGSKASDAGKIAEVEEIAEAGKVEAVEEIISEADRLKLVNWEKQGNKISEELYLKYKKVFDNEQYFNQITGETKWPGQFGDINTNGFLKGKYEKVTLKPGKHIDRYGGNNGTFFGEEGTSISERAMAPNSDFSKYNIYEIEKEIPMKEGKIAPWFDEPGLGTQYQLDEDFTKVIRKDIEQLVKLGKKKENEYGVIDWLLDNGYIKKVG